MWVFQNNSFLSVVAHNDKPGFLLVRSRVKGDIEKALPGVDVWDDPKADYRYRAIATKEQFKQALAEGVDRIDYGNFKDSVKDHERHNAYMGVWHVMARAYGAFVGHSRSSPD